MMQKRIVCLLLVLSLSFVLNLPVMAAGQESGGEVLEMLYEETSMTSEVVTYEMAKEIENTNLGAYIERIMKTRSEYAVYYGGVYLKNGELFVKLTNTDSDVISYIEKATNSAIKYEKCEASLNELEAIRESILDYIENFEETEDEELYELISSIVSIAICIEKNEVRVGIKECNDKKIDLFHKYIMDSECIVFKTDFECANHVSYVKPGDKIYVMINGVGSPYSVGFRCKRLYSSGIYVYGFVTAAHGGVQNGYSVYSRNWDEIGHVWGKSYANGGTVDAAFVQVVNANYDCSNLIYQNTRLLSTSIKTLYEGNSIVKAGYKTNVTQGVVVTASVDEVDRDGILTRDMYETDYECDFGDSGGIVYSPGDYRVVGIHKGESPNELYPFGYAVKAANIVSALGVTLY